jgi:hypothetical protein
MHTFQIHIVEARFGGWRRRWGLLDDDDWFLSFNYMAVDLRRINGDRLFHLLLVLFDNLQSPIRSGLHLYTVYLGSDSLDLRLSRPLSGRLGLYFVSIEVVLIL